MVKGSVLSCILSYIELIYIGGYLLPRAACAGGRRENRDLSSA